MNNYKKYLLMTSKLGASKLRIYSLLLLLFFMSKSSMGQSPFMKDYNYQGIVTKGPEAAAIARFGEIPLNTSTGVPDISIPLEEIKINDRLSLPISISYHAGGLRVEDVTGLVGLHWSLIAGGSVDKDINGKNDDDYYFSNYTGIPALFNMMRDEVSHDASLLRKDFLRNAIDMNQDSYSFSFMGNNDNLYFAQGGWRSEFNNKKYKITKNGQQFKIVNDDGTAYYFGRHPDNQSTATGFSSSTFTTIPGYYDPDNIPTIGGITSWKLQKIEPAVGPSLNIEYLGTHAINYSTRASDVMTTSQNLGGDPPPCGCAPTMLYVNYTGKEFSSPLISKITGVNKIVDFAYDAHPSYPSAKLLNTITVSSITGEFIKRITFHYSGFGSGRAELKLDELRIYSSNNTDYQKYNFEYNPAVIPAFTSLDKDMFGYYNQAGNTYLISSNDPACLYTASSRTPSLAAAQAMINKIIYPTGGYSQFEYELNKEANDYAPGIRVRKVTSGDTYTASTNITEYSYSGLNGGLSFPYNAAVKTNIKQNCIETSFNSEILNPEISIKNYGYAKVLSRKKGALVDLVHEDRYDYGMKKFDNSLYAIKSYELDYTNTAQGLVPTVSHKYNYGLIEDRTVEVPVYQSGGTHVELRYGPVDQGVNCETVYDGVTQLSPLYSKWLFKNEQIDTTFTDFVPLVNHVSFSYEDIMNEQPTKIISLTSKGISIVNKIKYPTAYQNSALGTNLRNLLDRHILNETIESTFYSSTDGISFVPLKSNYFEFDPVTPFLKNVYQTESNLNSFTESHYVGLNFVKDISYKKVAEFLNYDYSGSLLSGRKVNGVTSSYIYDGFLNVIAAVSNAEADDIAFTSFESGANGNWQFSGLPYVSNFPFTGKYVYSLASGNISKSNLNSAKNFIVSYWSTTGPATIAGSTAIQGENRQGWTCFTHMIPTGTTSVILSGNLVIDDLKLIPVYAHMTSHTHHVAVGMTSSTDPKGMTTYYEYDGFGRLKWVKDQDGNIIKENTYHYKN